MVEFYFIESNKKSEIIFKKNIGSAPKYKFQSCILEQTQYRIFFQCADSNCSKNLTSFSENMRKSFT